MPIITDGPYAAAWRAHRRRDRIAWAWFLGYIPGVFLLSAPLISVFGGSAPFFGVALAWMGATWWASYRAVSVRCPRCGRPFFSRGAWHNGFARKCMHCGLPKWASLEPASSPLRPNEALKLSGTPVQSATPAGSVVRDR